MRGGKFLVLTDELFEKHSSLSGKPPTLLQVTPETNP